MVLLMAGYPMTFSDAKTWAMRNWPDIDIWDEEELPLIVARRLRTLESKFDFRCLPLEVNDELVVFFILYSIQDPRSTPWKYRTIKENADAVKFKEWILGHEGDEELAEKTEFTTVADPFYDWRRAYRNRPEAKKEADAGNEEPQLC